MNRTLKIFLSCASGAGIGAFVALQLNQYLWWLGMIAGGIIGYLSYDIKAVIKAVPRAYDAVKGWRPKKKNVLATVYFVLWGFSWVLLISAPVNHKMARIVAVFWTTCLMLSMIFSAKKASAFEENDKRMLYLLKFWNPLSLTFYWPFKMLIWCIPRIPNLLRFLGRFLKQLFIIIHSEIRLLCGVDAAIGAGVGYFAGNAIMGVVAGGVIGVINYKIISQKILKLHLNTNH